MTKEQFRAALPYASDANIQKFYQPIVETFSRFDINTPVRQATFLAQIAHESGSLKYVREIADGKAYEGRKSLGNTQPGDGLRYKGRGLIQLTGRANYKNASDFFGVDFISHPEMVEIPQFAAAVSGWFWYRAKLNAIADAGDFQRITKIINGGYNGLESRLKHHAFAKKAFGLK